MILDRIYYCTRKKIEKSGEEGLLDLNAIIAMSFGISFYIGAVILVLDIVGLFEVKKIEVLHGIALYALIFLGLTYIYIYKKRSKDVQAKFINREMPLELYSVGFYLSSAAVFMLLAWVRHETGI